MKVLAIDSSGLTASVAVVEDTQTIAEYTVNYKKTHSQTLLPMIDDMAKMIELDLQSIDAIAVAAGPGSFTGLRIGSATAKGLGLALGKPLISVPTVDGLAYQLFGSTDLICPIMDARRDQVYTGIYTFAAKPADKENDGLQRPVFQVLRMQMAISVEELISRLNIYQRPVTFLGDGVPVYQEMLAAGLQVPYTFAPAYMNRQRAAAVGALGIHYYKTGRFESAAEHKPEYLRVSQAERERAEREKKAPIEIRRMKVEDAAAAAELERQLFSDAWSEKGVLESIENPQTICLTAEKAGKFIGFLCAYEAAGEAEIARIEIDETWQRQGAGAKLLEAFLEVCREREIRKVLLDVRESNESARAFYKKQLFLEDGIRQKFYENPSEDAILMSRSIEAE